MEEIYRSQFRLPYSLYELLKASADENRRSVNAELIARLESTFKKMDAVRHSLGLPMNETEAGAPDTETPKRRARGVDKQALIESTLAGAGLSREDLLDAVSNAIESALSGMGAFPAVTDNDKPKPNTGPKPRKRYPKE